MRVVLIRHAKCDHPSGVTDHERPLNARGRRDAPEIGAWLAKNVQLTDGATVLVSSARRAQETWAGARTELTHAWEVVAPATEPRIYEASPAILRAVLREASEGAGGDLVALVGHSPGLPLLLSELSAPSDLRSEALSHFPTAAVAVLETEADAATACAGLGRFEVSSFAIPRG